MKILFVCTGNTCRSPMAELLARNIFTMRGIEVSTASAGISVYYPSPAASNAVEAMRRRGLELTGHISREVNEADAEADLMLAMTDSHKSFLLGMFPEHRTKVYTLGEYAGEDIAISDPYGTDIENYIKCADQLERLIEIVADKLTQNRIIEREK